MARWLMLAGALLLAVGLLLYIAPGLFNWFGRLPGDIRIEGERGRVFIPLTSMIIVSLALTLCSTCSDVSRIPDQHAQNRRLPQFFLATPTWRARADRGCDYGLTGQQSAAHTQHRAADKNRAGDRPCCADPRQTQPKQRWRPMPAAWASLGDDAFRPGRFRAAGIGWRLQRPMSASVAAHSRTRSSGAIPMSRPRCPPLTYTVSNASALASTRSRRFSVPAG